MKLKLDVSADMQHSIVVASLKDDLAFVNDEIKRREGWGNLNSTQQEDYEYNLRLKPALRLVLKYYGVGK